MHQRIHDYYILTKPGIIRGNLLAVVGGFLLASNGSVSLDVLVATVIGSALVIGSGCVFNNIIDKDIDKKMKRTESRALAKGTVSTAEAATLGAILGLSGLAVLQLFTNTLTTLVGLTGFIFYVVVYAWWKRYGPSGTIIGSISGSIPPVAGYTAVSNEIDMTAILLFLILTLWQMPHFYAIAIFRSKDYAAAKIPVLPLVKGVYQTQVTMIAYIAAFTIVSLLLTVFGYTGFVYLLVMALLGLSWLNKAVKGLKVLDADKWAKSVFGYSLRVLSVFCVLISIDHWLI